MGFATKPHRGVEGLAAVALSSALFYFGNGLEPRWPLMWFACVPLLWYSLRTRWWIAGVCTVIVMPLGGINVWSHFTSTLGMPRSTWLAIFLIAGCVLAVGTILFRALVLRRAIWSGVIALPAVWVALEYLHAVATVDGTAGSLAYSQLKFLPFLQLASVTGPWGMTFVLLMVSSAVAIWLHARTTRVLLTTLALLACVLLFGVVRMLIPTGQTLRVGLIASDRKGNDPVQDFGPATERLFQEYARVAENLAQQGAQAIVIPEKLGIIVDGKSEAADSIFQSLADNTGVTVVAGVVRASAGAKYNEARVYTPRRPVTTYEKEHLLPPFESYLTPGTKLVILPRRQERWGVAVCKDMDFASPARLYGRAGVGVMLVPAWDFGEDRSWHGHIAVMRGVEDGFSVVRAAKDGFLTVSDDRGRILGEQRSDAAAFPSLLVNVPVEHHWTAYQYLGDWFAWVAIASMFVAIGQAVAKPHANTTVSRTNALVASE